MFSNTRNTSQLVGEVRSVQQDLSKPINRNQQHKYPADTPRWDGGGTSVELRQLRSSVVEDMRVLTMGAEAETRNLHPEERSRFAELETRFHGLTRGIADAEDAENADANGARSINGAIPGGNEVVHEGNNARDSLQSRSAGPARLRANQSIAEHYRSRGQADKEAESLSFDGFVRGMAGKGWNGYELEQRAMSGLTDPSGGILMPTATSNKIIDLARAKSVVTQAGAQSVPMETREVILPRLESDMEVEWMAEMAKQEDSSNTFGSLKLKAKTVRAMALISNEIIEDVDNLEGFISQAVAAAIAAEIDQVALFGSSVTNPEEPTGLLNTPGIVIVPAPATGTPTWADLVRSQTIIRNQNFEPSALITNPLVDQFLSLQTDTSGQFIRPPAAIDGLPRLTSSKVHVLTDKSHTIMGDFGRLVIGWRSQIRVKVSEDFALDRNAVALRVTARVDVGVERAGAFHIRQVNTAEA